MTIAHLKSRLAIKSCIPVDFKNTVFLAHYDITEEENLKGIRPVGYRYALEFDGINDSVTVNRVISDDFTIEFWFKSTQGVASGTGYAWYHGAGMVDGEVGGITNDFGVSLYSDGTIIAGVGNPDTHVYSSPGYNDGKWHHVAFTRVKSNGAISLYVDGNLVMTATGGTQSLTAPSKITFGSLQTSLNYFKGRITDVRIWNVARNQQEIKENMNKELNGNEIGLVGYWKLNEGSGSIALDYSSNRNHGKIYGATWSDGQIIFTLRPSEGKYGGCIAVEDATTNLVKNGDFSQGDTDWVQSHTGTVIDTNVSMPMFTKAVRMRRYDSQHNWWYQDITGQPQQATYTLSQYIKLENYTSGIIGALIFFFYTDGTYTFSLTDVDYTKIGVWQYVTTTATPNQAKTLEYIRVYAPWSNNLNGSFLCTGVQLEQKPYATSFVNGSRDKGVLQYPLIIDPNNFTLNFWAKCTDGGVGPFYVDILVTTDYNNRVFFRPTNTTTINGGRVVNGTTSFIGELNLINDITQWNMYTLVSEGSTMRIYQNGVKLGENQSILQLNSPSNYLAFNRDNNPRNALFDEVRIDRVPRTDTEIMEWYISQAPFYPKGIHKKLL